jgi:class 3 adenylate cyclase
MQPDILKKRLDAAVSERCFIVCATVGADITFEEGSVIRDAMNQLDTDGWWFFNPATFIIAFRSARSGADRARACEAALARIRQDNPAFVSLGVGVAEGPVLTSIASAGNLDTPPIGNVVNEASRKASKNAS